VEQKNSIKIILSSSPNGIESENEWKRNSSKQKKSIMKCKTSYGDVNEKQHKAKINITRNLRHYF
jgi:hypothetical protein